MAKKSTTTRKFINFEKSIKQLETLVAKLEKGDLSLEDSLKHFEQGIKLTRECKQALETAEQKISLLNDENGEWVEKELDVEDVSDN